MRKQKPVIDKEYKTIVGQHKPRGWRIVHDRPYSDLYRGICDWDTRKIHCSWIHDIETLLTFLHECGHVRLLHDRRTLPFWREEYEAERYALTAMREHLRVPNKLLDASKVYVRNIYKGTFSDDANYAERRWMGL